MEGSSKRAYYEAYDDRYKQVHNASLRWFSSEPSPIVSQVMEEYGIAQSDTILEIGCGEGRDAGYLLSRGYDVLATDISREAILFCQQTYPDYAKQFQMLNCIAGQLDQQFDFIYAVAVVHMLVLNGDRNGFYQFRAYLCQQTNGIPRQTPQPIRVH